MFYYIYCSLIMAGYSACGLLLGGYMMLHAGAREMDLGYLFMIQPMTIFLRPLICAQADRYQSHKQLLSFFAIITALAYVPFILMPFVCQTDDSPRQIKVVNNEDQEAALLLHQFTCSNARLRFWFLVIAHLIGSIGFCGVRSLGDALAVNFAKRTGSAFARYRKYGAISFGSCGYLLGHINQDWLLPDFVPSFIVYSSCFFVLSALVYLWPDEYFRIVGQDIEQQQQQDFRLPDGGEIVAHMARKLGYCFACSSSSSIDATDAARTSQHHHQMANVCKQQQQQNDSIETNQVNKTQLDRKSFSLYSIATNDDNDSTSCASSSLAKTSASKQHLTIKQQGQIFYLLIRRDFRIPLYLLVIFYGGLVGYAGPNFVYTYMNKVCHETETCDAAHLAGLTMIVYCCVESIVYIIIDRFCSKTNRVLLFQLTFISLMVHYYFYGFILDHVSPYYFLVESLHGVEYGISLATSMELGYDFGNEVELLVPELISKQIISPEDNRELVKLALMATMSGFCTLVYDGFGCILGSFIFGQITGHYSFNTTWLVIANMALIGFIVILIGYAIGRCFHFQPKISKLRKRKSMMLQTEAAAAAAALAESSKR